MAFQRSEFQSFSTLLQDLLEQGGDHAQAGIAGGFLSEGCLSDPREDSYWGFLDNPPSPDGWLDGHQAYLSDRIQRRQGSPETFQEHNQNNWLPTLELPQMLVRMERLDDLAKGANGPDREPGSLAALLQGYLADPQSQPAKGAVEKLLDDYNSCRDLRPAFAGFWGEVEDLFESSDGWADRLRDRFGLGHLDPQQGEPISVILFRYRVQDVKTAPPFSEAFAALPTVLDGTLNPFFLPGGHCMNLEPAREGDKDAPSGEVVHRRLPYRPEHLFRLGRITTSPGKGCEQARRIHWERFQQSTHSQGRAS